MADAEGRSGHTHLAKKEPSTIYIRVVFLKIGEVDTLKEQFYADVFMQARWREASLDHSTSKKLEDIDWKSYWNPKLDIQNTVSDPKQSVWHDVQFSQSGEAFVLEKRRVKGWFAENFELHDFPFDVQHLSLLITTDLTSTDLELVEDDQDVSSVIHLNFVDEQEWEIRDYVESVTMVTRREYTSTKHKFSSLLVRCCAFRRAGFFVWNILCVMGLITSLSLCTFAVDRDKPGSRLHLSFTLVLTGVTFKFVVSQSLPKISYLTYLDQYILISMGILYLVCIWHAVITRFTYDSSLSKTMDLWAFIVFIILYVIFQIAFITVVFFNGRSKRRDVHQAERRCQEKTKRILGDTYIKNRVRRYKGRRKKVEVGIL